MLTKPMLRLAAQLLRMASNEFSNHGCNDFDLTKLFPQEADRKKLLLLYHQMNEGKEDPKDFQYEQPPYKWTADFCMMTLMAKLLEEEANSR